MNLPSLFQNDLWSDDPFRRMAQMQRQMDRLFQDFQNLPASPSARSRENFLPSCDVRETQDHYLLSLDIPGMRKDDIKIELQGNLLTVSGERSEAKEEKKKGNYRSERYFGSFARGFTLPENVKADQIEAEYKDGVLNIALPKAEATQAKQIEIGESKPGIFDRLLGRGPKSEEKEKTQSSVGGKVA